MTPAFPAKSGT